MTELSDQELLRYSRQLLLNEVDFSGQQKLKESHVIVMGVGGLGSLSAAYLVGAGIGKVTLVDDDLVELTNLHRQLIYNENDVGTLKVEAAKAHLSESNPSVEIDTISQRLTFPELVLLFSNSNLVLDGTDNFPSRFLINKACVNSKTALVSAAVSQFSGQMSTFDFQENTPCYACLFSEAEMETEGNGCSENGVLGPSVGLMASYQALHAMKFLLKLPVESLHHLMMVDMLTGNSRSIGVKVDENCKVCSTNKS